MTVSDIASDWVALHEAQGSGAPIADKAQHECTGLCGTGLCRRGERILRKDKNPPDSQDAAVELVLQQAQALGGARA